MYKPVHNMHMEKSVDNKGKMGCGKLSVHMKLKSFPQLFHKMWINLRKPKVIKNVWISKKTNFVEKCCQAEIDEKNEGFA